MFTAVTDASHVAEARRLVGDLARRIGLPAARIDQVAIVVTELATNILKHGGGGHIHAGRCDDAGPGTGDETRHAIFRHCRHIGKIGEPFR